MYCIVIWHLRALWNDHHDKSSNHVSPYKVITVLLTIFFILYITAPMAHLFYTWRFVPLNPLHLFTLLLWKIPLIAHVGFLCFTQLQYSLPSQRTHYPGQSTSSLGSHCPPPCDHWSPQVGFLTGPETRCPQGPHSARASACPYVTLLHIQFKLTSSERPFLLWWLPQALATTSS